MKKDLCCVTAIVSLFLIGALIGGVEQGAPTQNLWWTVPCVIVLFIAIKIGNLKE